ncbi:MAG: hypothetical protein HUJ59_00535 [Bacilli bacterium]|nr:hypothetical protein [Bacilli bacterium]
MKRTKLLLIGLSALAICAVVAVSLPKVLVFNSLQAETQTYTFSVDTTADVTESEATSGSFTRNTSSGNPIVFEGSGMQKGKDGESSDWLQLPKNASVQNSTRISGMTQLTIKQATQVNSKLKITYGLEKSSMIFYEAWTNPLNSGWNDNDIVINFEVPVDFFKIENESDVLVHLKGLNIKYGCQTVSETDYKEITSGDLLYNASTAENLPSNVTIDYEATEVSSNLSGYSWKVTGNAERDGWPSLLINLGNTYNFNNCGLQFMAKNSVIHPWVSFKLYNSSWEQVTNEAGVDLGSANASGWRKGSISADTFTGNLIAGKSLNDVAFLRVGFNFDQHKGEEQTMWLDEFKIVEKLLNNNNWEQMVLDDGQTNASSNYVETKYTYNSNSARTFKFDTTTAPTDDGTPTFVCFNLQDNNAFGGSLFKMNTGTLSFDYRPSLDLIDNANPYKHQLSIKLNDEAWSTQSAWVDIRPNGKYGYNVYQTDKGYFHCDIDMANVVKSESFGKIIRLYIGFFGLKNANQSTCYITIDNLGYTPAV